MKKKDWVLSIYKNGKFIGYVKDFRKHRNNKYRFNKTKNLKNAIKSKNKGFLIPGLLMLTNSRDMLYYNKSFSFDIIEITNQELRRSKLLTLRYYKEKDPIFKIKKRDN